MNGNVEIERKFLVKDPTVIDGIEGKVFKQGYLSVTPERTVRIRRHDDHAWLTIKSAVVGISRQEFEYSIPAEDAEAMLTGLCTGTIITKIRHEVPHEGHVWEIDRHLAPHEGLIVAEVELQSETETVSMPSWLGIEVTHDHRYSNSYLSTHPNESVIAG